MNPLIPALFFVTFFACAFLICVRLELLTEPDDWKKRKVWQRSLLVCVAGFMLSIFVYIGVR